LGCRLYLVRHGETDWNVREKFQGHSNVPLSERGREQARSLAKRLAKRKLAAFFASDLQRALETASILAAPHGLRVETVDSLREMNFGVWEGRTVQEIRENCRELAERWWSNPVDTCLPEGETLKELACRVNDAIARIVGRFQNDEEVVVVSHGGPLRAAIATVLGMDLKLYWRLRLDNASLSRIDFRSPGEGILVLLNDRSHLEETGN
jgi:alpha-ribazole phosphatase/probable phosphoglycerate mutase